MIAAPFLQLAIPRVALPLNLASWIGLFVSLLILAISGWTLYLSHYKEHRSEVRLLPQTSNSPPDAFGGGNSALDGDAYWNGHPSLKLTNTEDKGGFVSSVGHELIGLKKGSETHSPEGAALEDTRVSRPLQAGTEIEPHSTRRYRPNLRISPDEDVEILIDHDAALIQTTVTIEDNQGSYDATHVTEMELTGPDTALRRYEEENGD